jgi:hypothetical protein
MFYIGIKGPHEVELHTSPILNLKTHSQRALSSIKTKDLHQLFVLKKNLVIPPLIPGGYHRKKEGKKL